MILHHQQQQQQTQQQRRRRLLRPRQQQQQQQQQRLQDAPTTSSLYSNSPAPRRRTFSLFLVLAVVLVSITTAATATATAATTATTGTATATRTATDDDPALTSTSGWLDRVFRNLPGTEGAVAEEEEEADEDRTPVPNFVESMRRLVDSAVEEHRHHRGRLLQSTNQVLPEGVSLQPICKVLESNFDPSNQVRCVCTGSSVGSFSIGCEFHQPTCGSGLKTVCGRPFIALSLVDFQIFSTTTCIYDYTRRGVPLNDTCISMEVCPGNSNYVMTPHNAVGDSSATEAGAEDAPSLRTGVRFCGCTAQHGTRICKGCDVCDHGGGVSIDCSNVNAEVVTGGSGGSGEGCQDVDVDMDLSGAQSRITGFIPNLNGLCSQLENTLDNAVECDCRDSGRGNFRLSCTTPEMQCNAEGVCGKVSSSVTYRDGDMKRITSCSDSIRPYDLQETCVTFELQDADDGEEGTTPSSSSQPQHQRIVSCSATYDGRTCRECRVCQGDEEEFRTATTTTSSSSSSAGADDEKDEEERGGEGGGGGGGGANRRGRRRRQRRHRHLSSPYVELDEDTGGWVFEGEQQPGANDNTSGTPPYQAQPQTEQEIQEQEQQQQAAQQEETEQEQIEQEILTSSSSSSSTSSSTPSSSTSSSTASETTTPPPPQPGVYIDCSNVAEWAVVRTCQPMSTSVARALEFVPAFVDAPRRPESETQGQPGDTASATAGADALSSSSSSTLTTPFGPLSKLLLGSMMTSWLVFQYS